MIVYDVMCYFPSLLVNMGSSVLRVSVIISVSCVFCCLVHGVCCVLCASLPLVCSVLVHVLVFLLVVSFL